jgi:hypothetical protein
VTDVGIVVKATDKASAVLDAIGRNGDASIGRITGGKLKDLPQQMQKASGAFVGLSGAIGGFGGEIGGVVNKVSGLATMLTGPVGIALAAVSAAVSVGTAVWNVYAEEAKSVEEASKSVAKAFEAMDTRLAEQRKGLSALTDEVRFYGMSSTAVSVAMAEEAANAAEQGDRNAAAAKKQMDGQIAAKQKEFYDLDREHRARMIGNSDFEERSAALKQEIDDLKAQGASLDVGLAKAAKAHDVVRETLAIQRDKMEADRQEKELIERKSQALTEFTERMSEQNAEYASSANMEIDRTYAQYQKETALAKRNKDEQAAFDKEQTDTALAQERRRIAMVEGLQKEFQETQKRNTEQTSDIQKQAALSAGAAMGDMFAGMIAGSDNAGKTMLSSVVRSSTGAIQAYAMSASAAAYFSQAGIPFIGPILASAAMATASGLLLGLLSKLPSFHTGGVVGADAPRMSGMRSDERLVKALVGERFIAPGSGSSGSEGLNVTIVNKNTVNQSSADTKRNANQIDKILKRQQRRRTGRA